MIEATGYSERRIVELPAAGYTDAEGNKPLCVIEVVSDTIAVITDLKPR